MQKRSKKTRKIAKDVVRLHNLGSYTNYVFAWFANAGLYLCVQLEVQDLSQNRLSEIIDRLQLCVGEAINVIKERGIDPCRYRSLPLTGNDPGEKMNLCYASDVLNKIKIGAEVEEQGLPPALSIDFAEYTRTFGGAGKKKREAIVIGDDVLSLVILGSFLTLSYNIGKNEYGYVFVRAPHIAKLEILRNIHKRVKRVVRSVAKGEGSFSSYLVGFAAAIAIERTYLMEVISNPVMVEFLRLTRTGNKVLVKGFESVDVVGIAKMLLKAGVTGATYRLVAEYPSKAEIEKRGLSSLRRFIELYTNSIMKYYMYRKPIYIYEILRALHQEEFDNAGKAKFGDKWAEIVKRFEGLSNIL